MSLTTPSTTGRRARFLFVFAKADADYIPRRRISTVAGGSDLSKMTDILLRPSGACLTAKFGPPNSYPKQVARHLNSSTKVHRLQNDRRLNSYKMAT